MTFFGKIDALAGLYLINLEHENLLYYRFKSK